MSNYCRPLLILMLSAVLQIPAQSQSLPVGAASLDDYYRWQQLLGSVDSSVSFMLRPLSGNLSPDKNLFFPDTTERGFDLLDIKNSSSKTADGKGYITLLPINLQTQVNSETSYGWNDGPLIPAAGFQLLISPGVFMKYGRFSLQFKPELVTAENSYFEQLPKKHYEVIWARYYDFYNNIDLPQKFGSKAYSKAYWGQSSFRVNFKSWSAGLSTENLWWGPGIRSSLIMSNTAPGFKHLTINTLKPVITPLGSFEGQIIAGRLENSGFGPLSPDREYFYNPLFIAKPNDRRYLAGFTINWQPQWVPGLFLGMSRTRQTYSKDLSKVSDYLPFFSSLGKTQADGTTGRQQTLSSIFMRWLWQEEHAEVYFEYGLHDRTNTFRELLLNPQDSRGYLFGLRKIFALRKNPEEKIMIGLEVTQLQHPSTKKIAEANSWYINHHVRHGYTNRGQVLGAGIGPGGNLQSLEVSWLKGLKRIGVQIERQIHDDDFYYYAYLDSKDWRRHWVDISVALSGEWNYKNLIFNSKLAGINSWNYQWLLYPNTGTHYMNQKALNKFNMQVQAGVTYRF